VLCGGTFRSTLRRVCMHARARCARPCAPPPPPHPPRKPIACAQTLPSLPPPKTKDPARYTPLYRSSSERVVEKDSETERERGRDGERDHTHIRIVHGTHGCQLTILARVGSRPGAAWTILRYHTISAWPSKQHRMVRTFQKVY